jgi:hypothetical protein
MRYETSENLRHLEDTDWFAHVGEHDRTSRRCIVLTSWEEAIQHCSSPEWGNVQLEMSNRHREKILAVSPARFCQWNELVDEIKKFTMPLVRRKVAKAVQEHNLPKSFVDTVDWDILGLCMESEYVDVVPPSFFSAGGYWYVRGHFPCGWVHEEPPGKGKPIIY